MPADNVVDVAARREAVLDLLRDGPMAKRDVIAATGHSRSTVDRAVAELRAAGLVAERAGGYETTLSGVLALAVRREYDATAAALSAATPALAPLWKESPVDPAVVRDATVRTSPAAVDSLAATLAGTVRAAEAVRVTLPVVSDVPLLAAVHDRVAAGDPVAVVCSPETFAGLCESYPGWLATVADAGGSDDDSVGAAGDAGGDTDARADAPTGLRVGDLPEFGLLWAACPDGERAALVVYDGTDLHAVVENESSPAVDWVADRFENRWTAATERPEVIAGIDADGFTPEPGTGPRVETAAESVPTATADGDAGEADGSRGGGADGSGDDIEGDSDPELLVGGFAVRGSPLRTPAVGTTGGATATLWFRTDVFERDWETLLKWDYLTLGYRREKLFGHVYDPEAEQIRVRTDLPASTVSLGEWHHLAYACEEATARLFLDGRLADETTHDHEIRIRPLGAVVGAHYRDRDTGVHDPEYTGEIVDARLYDGPLSAERVRRLCETTAPASATGERPEH